MSCGRRAVRPCPLPRPRLLSAEYAGETGRKLARLRKALASRAARPVGELAPALLNLRAMDIECTPYAMAYCYVTRIGLCCSWTLPVTEAQELAEIRVTLAGYDQVLAALAATEPQTVSADPCIGELCRL